MKASPGTPFRRSTVAIKSPKSLAILIGWKFTVTMGRESSRYGQYGGRFWKQYLPSGLSIPNVHPPKAIDETHYLHAQRHADE